MADGKTAGIERAEKSGRLSIVATATDGIRVLSLAWEIDSDSGRHAPPGPARLRYPPPDRGRPVTGHLHGSSGINILIAAHRAVSEADGWLRLAAPGEAVMRTLSLVGVDTVIDCRGTLRQALSN